MKMELVAGGAGFVRRHLCRVLLDQGHEVICVDSIVPLTGAICPVGNRGWPLYNSTDYENVKYSRQDCRKLFQQTAETAPDVVYKGKSDKFEGVFPHGGYPKLQDEFGMRHRISFEKGIRRGVEFLEQRM